jgi:hypothetical protein
MKKTISLKDHKIQKRKDQFDSSAARILHQHPIDGGKRYRIIQVTENGDIMMGVGNFRSDDNFRYFDYDNWAVFECDDVALEILEEMFCFDKMNIDEE